MSRRRSYLAAAFNARPFGMPVPPNWFALAAFGLLGAFLNPAFWLIGTGLEGLYLWWLSRNARFRKAVDAAALPTRDAGLDEWESRYLALAGTLDRAALARQAAMEAEAEETARVLVRNGAIDAQVAGVRQMAWLHLKLLAARAAFSEVLQAADAQGRELAAEQERLQARLAGEVGDAELERSLRRQLELIETRRGAHADAGRRRDIVEAELGRLRQQMSLVREQALLATDEAGLAQSLDAVGATLSEANRWFSDQRDMLAGLSGDDDEIPAALLARVREGVRQQAQSEDEEASPADARRRAKTGTARRERAGEKQ